MIIGDCQNHDEWIRMFVGNCFDFNFVDSHKDEIAARLPECFFCSEEHANLALSGLNGSSAILNELHEYKIVSDLITLGLQSPFLTPDNPIELELEQHLATALLNRGRIDDAEDLIYKGLSRIDTKKDSAELLALYINMIQLQVYRKEFSLDENQLNAIKRMGYNMCYPMGDIYATVALAYFNQRMEKEMKEAIARATREYAFDHGAPKHLKEIGIARMFLRNAIHLRLDPTRIDEAEEILEHAANLFAQTKYHMQYVSILYEKSQIYLVKGDYPSSLQWINLAIEEQLKHPDPNPYYDALLKHGKGLVYYYLEEYSVATEYFLVASRLWKNMGNIYNHALSLNAIGSTELAQQRAHDALSYLSKARALCETHEDHASVRELLETIDENISNANNLLGKI